MCVWERLNRGEIADTSAGEIPHRLSRGLCSFFIYFLSFFKARLRFRLWFVHFFRDSLCLLSHISSISPPLQHTHTQTHKPTHLKPNYMLRKGKCTQTERINTGKGDKCRINVAPNNATNETSFWWSITPRIAFWACVTLQRTADERQRPGGWK